MVHALLQIQRMLNSNGLLIALHDLPTPHVIEIQMDSKVHKVGWLTDKNDFANVRSAFNALAQVVAAGNFRLEDQRDFAYNIYLDNLIELQDWLAEWWSSAILSDEIIQRIKKLTQDEDMPSQIVLAVQARMIKLQSGM